MAADPMAMADVEALRGLALSYARHADRREPDLLAALFEPYAELSMARRGDTSPPGVSRGRSEISAAVARLSRLEVTFHFVGNHTVDVTGDDATGEVYCVAHHVSVRDDQRVDYVMFIIYHDRYRRHGDAWMFAARRLDVQWTEERVLSSPA